MTVAADKFYDPDVVLSTVLQNGSERWLSIGLTMGFTLGKVNENTNGISVGADKLKSLFEVKAQKVGRDKAAEQLLAACRTIPQPIIGAVMDQLAGEHTNYNDKQFMICTEYLLEYSVYCNKNENDIFQTD